MPWKVFTLQNENLVVCRLDYDTVALYSQDMMHRAGFLPKCIMGHPRLHVTSALLNVHLGLLCDLTHGFQQQNICFYEDGFQRISANKKIFYEDAQGLQCCKELPMFGVKFYSIDNVYLKTEIKVFEQNSPHTLHRNLIICQCIIHYTTSHLRTVGFTPGDWVNRRSLLLVRHAVNEYGGWVKNVKQFRLFHKPMGVASIKLTLEVLNFWKCT